MTQLIATSQIDLAATEQRKERERVAIPWDPVNSEMGAIRSVLIQREVKRIVSM
jgi:hypothetical protein